MASRGSENAGPPPGPAPSQPTAVLGDVTNTTRQRSAPGDAISVKPTEPGHESGSACTAIVPMRGDHEADSAVVGDAQQVTEYLPDIYWHLHEEEVQHLPEPSYMDKQPHVTSKMRAILVDWLVDVHKKYKLCPYTLFLAIGLVDRFLEKRNTMRRHLQLVGVTALMIASKFEEMYPPQINDFVYVTDKAYTPEEVMRMEVSMLSTLDFRICRPTAAHFLELYQRVNGCTEAHRELAQYLLELTLVDYKMIRYAPSHLAAAAVLLSNKLLQRQPRWTPAAVQHTRLTEPMLTDCGNEICGLLEHAESSPLQAVRKKFSQTKHHAVARMNFAAGPGHAQQERPAAGATQAPAACPGPPGAKGPAETVWV